MRNAMEEATVIGRILGTIAFMKDMRDMGRTPNYINLETRLIELYEQYEKLKEQRYV